MAEVRAASILHGLGFNKEMQVCNMARVDCNCTSLAAAGCCGP